MTFEFNSYPTNAHGTNAEEIFNGKTLYGFNIKFFPNVPEYIDFSKRIIFYFPSGRWWRVSFYAPFGNTYKS